MDRGRTIATASLRSAVAVVAGHVAPRVDVPTRRAVSAERVRPGGCHEVLAGAQVIAATTVGAGPIEAADVPPHGADTRRDVAVLPDL